MSTQAASSTERTSGPATDSSAMSLPKDGLSGLREHWRSDIVSGFIVFLIALPLSLGIAMASGVPPLAGVISAIVGGVVVSMISGSFVTINGPAAGLIIVVLSSVDRLGGGVIGYKGMLAAVVVSGFILVLLGIFKAGELGKLFPPSVVHGMLAAIGITIMTKQLPFMLGVVPPAKEPLPLILAIPQMLANLNPAIAAIGFVSLLLLIVHSTVRNTTLRKIPAPVFVIVVATALGACLSFDRAHDYVLFGVQHQIAPLKCLVALPTNVANSLTMPDFMHCQTYAFCLSVISITLVQGVESLLSCAAVNRLDTYRRQSNPSRDIAAVGLGSMISAMVGGLPIIAEIVRSSTNVANGARTRWSNFFHGLFVLSALLFAAGLINRIPLAALAAILLFTGYNLTRPRVFKQINSLGAEQTIVFIITMIATLCTDLLIGVFTGVLAKIALHIARGASPLEMFRTEVACLLQNDDSVDVVIKGVLVFTNYLPFKNRLDKLPRGRTVRIDLGHAKLIDHSVMEQLHQYAQTYALSGGKIDLVALEKHQPASSHPLSSRRLLVPSL